MNVEITARAICLLLWDWADEMKKHSFHDYQNATLILWVDKTTSKLPYTTAQSTFKNQACHTHKKFFPEYTTQKGKQKENKNQRK